MTATSRRVRVLLLLLVVTVAGTGCKGFTWGLNTSGQLGDGTVGNKSAPQAVGPGPGWSSVDTGDGGGFSCAIRDTGALARVWCWGVNYFGYLGDGTTTYEAVPVQAIGMTQAHQVTAGVGFACATRSATHNGGQLWCWGFNNTGEVGDGWGQNTSGQLGDTTTSDHGTPERIGAAANWHTVDARFNHTAGIQSTL